MDLKERIKRAKKILGPGTKIVKKSAQKKITQKKARKISSFIPGTSKNSNQSFKSKYQQCGKKKRYRSEHEARLSANRAETARGKPLRVYQCPICGGWHITQNIFKLYA